MKNAVCQKCGMGCQLPCIALKLLLKIYNEQRIREKTELIKNLRTLLQIVDCEPADELRELGEKIIDRFPELSFIKGFDIKIGYVRSYELKTNKGKIKFADCRKVSGPYKAFLPFDFIITVYESNMALLNENQKKLIIYHELRHIETTPKGLGIRPHDIEDFENILQPFGLKWNSFGNEIPDILAGGENGEEKDADRKKACKKKGTKLYKNKADQKGTSTVGSAVKSRK